MKINYQKTIVVDELADLIPFKAGATWSALWQIFYYTRLLKYVHRSHYPQIKISYNKICTDKNLHKLCQLGYFNSPQKDVYCATNKVLPILKEADFFTELLPSESVGKGDINELNNTRVFISLIKQEHFYTFLYPNFDYLIPDALMVSLDKENKRYRLIFLEVERKKPNWKEWLENKKLNYSKLATDYRFYTKWQDYCNIIGFPKPDISKLKFSYQIIK
jgi:hypothetical protein